MEYIEVDTIEGIKKEVVYNVNDFPYEKFEVNIKRCFTKKDYGFLNIPATFDIECTTIEPKKDEKGNYIETPQGFMYHWQYCIKDTVVFGRTWEEFKQFNKKLKKHLHLDNKMRLVVYVHNLSYEFQFMKEFITIKDMFAKDKRKPMKIITDDGIEYRCSYFLSNMSLKKFCENSKLCKHYKMSGDDFDYSKIRTPKTPLTMKEKGYCYNDVRGLSECIETLMKEDTLATIPLTNTGYVRRDFRQAMNNRKCREIFKKLALDKEEYELLRKVFRGGDTHANRYYTNQILDNVCSKDLSSSYPTVMLECYFPMSRFTHIDIEDYSDLEYHLNKYCCVFTLELINARVKPNVAIPYIDIAHCEERKKIIGDNGRVLKADYIKINITEIDFQIINETYDYDDLSVTNFMYATRSKLPVEFRQMIMKYYYGKTMLKGISYKEYEYMKSKNKLNSSFGMCVTDICHSDVNYIDNIIGWVEIKPDVEASLEKFYKSRNNFLCYQWGIYVTAHARKRLRDMLNIVGMDAIYCDTDSIKYINPQIHDKEFEEKNKELLSLALNNDIVASCDRDGKQFPLGVWDDDGEYLQFKTLGAKKYAFRKLLKNKSKIKANFGIEKFVTTVSGMSKEKGSKRVGTINRFNIGMTYKDVGRTTSWFNDCDSHEITINGDTFTTASNIGILETTYTLGVTTEYWELFKNLNVQELTFCL